MENVLTDDAVELCAAGEAAWHAAAYAGLGKTWHRDPGIAWAPNPAHRFLLTAITLRPVVDVPGGIAGIVCDSWAALEGRLPAGWQARAADPWMVRPAARCAIDAPPGVTIQRTDDSLLFEHTAFLAAGGAPPDRPGELHPAGSAAWPDLHLYLAHSNGRPVGAALAVVHSAGVVVSGVAVMAVERRQGIGAALTAAAVRTAPERPATLNASDLGIAVYRRLGFRACGRPLHWQPPER